MPCLTKNKFINGFEIDFLLNDLDFNDDEIELVKNIWFDDFNGKNINIKNKTNGANIAMNLVIKMKIEILDNNIITKFLGKETLQKSYSYLLAKLILNRHFDINSMSNAKSTLLSNIIWTNSIDVLKFIINNRDDINVDFYESKFWNTYLDLANALEHLEIAEILEKVNKKSSSSSISNVFNEHEKIENLVLDYNENFLLPNDIKNKLDLAIEYKRNKNYIEALELYYEFIIPKVPNHPTILYSLAKLILTIGHLELSYNLFNRVISIQEVLWREEYVFDSKVFINDLIKARDSYDKKLHLQAQVSWQWQIQFTPISEIDWRNIFWLYLDFNNEYDYLKYIFENS